MTQSKQFAHNQLILNPHTFSNYHFTKLYKCKNFKATILEIEKAKIETKNTVKPLWLTIADHLSCEECISELCKKAAKEFPAVS